MLFCFGMGLVGAGGVGWNAQLHCKSPPVGKIICFRKLSLPFSYYLFKQPMRWAGNFSKFN